MLKPLTLAASAMAVAVVCADTEPTNAGDLGGWSDVQVTANATALLAKALSVDANYAEYVTIWLCYTKIESLRQQVVAGMNYEYTAVACEVDTANIGQGKCPAEVIQSCTPQTYKIKIFEQSWTNTLSVEAIEPTQDTNGGSHGGSASSSSSAGSNSTGSDSDVGGDTATPSSTVPAPAPTSAASVPVYAGATAVLAVLASVWVDL